MSDKIKNKFNEFFEINDKNEINNEIESSHIKNEEKKDNKEENNDNELYLFNLLDNLNIVNKKK